MTLHAQSHMLRRPVREPLRAVANSSEGASTVRSLPMGVAPQTDPALEEALARGFREGREAGLSEGMKDAQDRIEESERKAREEVEAKASRGAQAQAAQIADRLARIDAFAAELDRAVQQHLDRLESDAVALAFEVVVQLLGDDEQRRQITQALVARAMGRLRTSPLRVRLNAKDLALLDSLLPLEGGLRHRYAGVEWVVDAKVDCGGCLLDTATGTLDARLDSQLTRLLQVWREVGAADLRSGVRGSQ